MESADRGAAYSPRLQPVTSGQWMNTTKNRLEDSDVSRPRAGVLGEKDN